MRHIDEVRIFSLFTFLRFCSLFSLFNRPLSSTSSRPLLHNFGPPRDPWNRHLPLNFDALTEAKLHLTKNYVFSLKNPDTKNHQKMTSKRPPKRGHFPSQELPVSSRSPNRCRPRTHQVCNSPLGSPSWSPRPLLGPLLDPFLTFSCTLYVFYKVCEAL